MASTVDTQEQMRENFDRFNQTLKKMDETTNAHHNSIERMSENYAETDKYLKFTLDKQHKRFMWVFGVSLSIVLITIVVAGLIIAMVMFKN